MSDQKEKSVAGNKNQWQEKISVARNGHFFSLILQISTCEKSKFQGKSILFTRDWPKCVVNKETRASKIF